MLTKCKITILHSNNVECAIECFFTLPFTIHLQLTAGSSGNIVYAVTDSECRRLGMVLRLLRPKLFA